MSRMQRSLFAELNALAEEISGNAEKVAAEKAAAPTPADPGGYAGPSSHPSAHADNNCQAASEGERSRENASDVKSQQRAPAVDNTPEMSQEGRQDDVQLNIGTHAAATGEDPAAEKDFKGTKDDPGTSHPAKTNDGEKYSSVSFKEARALCSDLGNEVLAHYVDAPADAPVEAAEEKEAELHGDQDKLDVDNDGKIEGEDLAKLRAGKKKEKKADEAADAETEVETETEEEKAAYAAGYELAEELSWDKEAAEASVREICANTLRETDEMADLVIGWLDKSAEADLDDVANAEDHSEPGDAMSGAGESPEAAMGDAAEESADLGEAGMGEEPGEDESIQELAMALEELGIPPEALLGAVGETSAEGDEAAGAEMADAAPKMAADEKVAQLNTIGRAVLNFKRSGNFQIKEARTKRSRLLRDEMKQHVLELVNR